MQAIFRYLRAAVANKLQPDPRLDDRLKVDTMQKNNHEKCGDTFPISKYMVGFAYVCMCKYIYIYCADIVCTYV